MNDGPGIQDNGTGSGAILEVALQMAKSNPRNKVRFAGWSAEIEKQFEAHYRARGLPFEGTDFSGRSDYGLFIAVGNPAGGLFTGAEGAKTLAQAALFGGTAGLAYDPCWHLIRDTYDNIYLTAFDVNTDAVAAATLTHAMSTTRINGKRGKGSFKKDDLYMLVSHTIK